MSRTASRSSTGDNILERYRLVEHEEASTIYDSTNKHNHVRYDTPRSSEGDDMEEGGINS